jgi:CheY-like chemotaxis protein
MTEVARSSHDWPRHPPLTLLADSDADTRALYAAFLELSACEIEQAEDGPTALAKAIARHPDIIVSETHLPSISGFDLCRLLHADEATREIPFIFVTADASAAGVQLAERSEVDALLVKPCPPATLANSMRNVLGLSSDLRARSRALRIKAAEQLHRSERVLARGKTPNARVEHRQTLKAALDRRFTTTPPLEPPSLHCPVCDRGLEYQRSHVGGVNERLQEQWDYFECHAGCGTFQYRQRTRKVRRVG